MLQENSPSAPSQAEQGGSSLVIYVGCTLCGVIPKGLHPCVGLSMCGVTCMRDYPCKLLFPSPCRVAGTVWVSEELGHQDPLLVSITTCGRLCFFFLWPFFRAWGLSLLSVYKELFMVSYCGRVFHGDFSAAHVAQGWGSPAQGSEGHLDWMGAQWELLWE